MMRITVVSIFIVIMITVSGCAMYQAPVMPPAGLLFSNTKAPMDVDAEKSNLGSKIGKANTITILSLFSFGDCSISTAAKKGNLQTINHADYNYTNILGIYQSFTTIVYGD